jgi:peptidoglycan/LPS O-acetylase OafA/YrhL
MEAVIQDLSQALSLSNREVSTAFWMLVLFLMAMCIKALREGLFAILKVISMKRMRRWALIMVTYTALICAGLYFTDLWSFRDMKATLLWLLSAGFYMVYQTVNREPPPKQLVGGILRNGFSIAVILEFLVGGVDLPFFIVFLLIPIAAFFAFISGPSNTNNPHEALGRRFANKVLLVIGCGLFIYATVVIIFDWENFWQLQTLRSFLLPISLSVLFIPYLWAILTYLAYEHITWRLYALPLPPSKRDIFMLRAFWEFGFRYHEVRNWWRYSIQTQPKDYESLINSLAESRSREYF